MYETVIACSLLIGIAIGALLAPKSGEVKSECDHHWVKLPDLIKIGTDEVIVSGLHYCPKCGLEKYKMS